MHKNSWIPIFASYQVHGAAKFAILCRGPTATYDFIGQDRNSRGGDNFEGGQVSNSRGANDKEGTICPGGPLPCPRDPFVRKNGDRCAPPRVGPSPRFADLARAIRPGGTMNLRKYPILYRVKFRCLHFGWQGIPTKYFRTILVFISLGKKTPNFARSYKPPLALGTFWIFYCIYYSSISFSL